MLPQRAVDAKESEREKMNTNIISEPANLTGQLNPYPTSVRINQPAITAFVDKKTSPDNSLLRVRFAQTKQDLHAAQRLRYQVFLEEYGVVCGANGLDNDEFDAFCVHLLVEEAATGHVVGTYRMLNASGAIRCGKRYGEDEFKGQLWQAMDNNLVELGRACVHPDFRSGATLMKLWQGIMDYLSLQGVRYAIGYASVGLRDGGENARATAAYLAALNNVWLGPTLDPISAYPTPRITLQDAPCAGEAPPLIKGYVRMGAFSIGAPAYDAVFNTADFPMLLDLTCLDKRYAKHFKVARSLTTLN